jgi:hypothetical protein
MYAECERKLNSELASFIDGEGPRDCVSKELNEIELQRRRKKRQLAMLHDKLKELEAASAALPLTRLQRLESAVETALQETAAIELDSEKYRHVYRRTQAQLHTSKLQGQMLGEQLMQVNWRLDQGSVLLNDNLIAAKTLTEKLESLGQVALKTQGRQLSKLLMRLDLADDTRQSLERTKKTQIMKMMPTKQQLLRHKILQLEAHKSKEIEKSLVALKHEHE